MFTANKIRSNKYLILAAVMLTLLGLAALLSHSAHHDSGQDECFACKFSSLLWIFSIVFIFFGLVEKVLFGIAIEAEFPRSRFLSSPDKRSPPSVS